MTKGSVKAFLVRKNIEISAKRYGIDALSAMAQGLFCSLLIGTIINTLGTQFNIGFLTDPVWIMRSGEAEIPYTVGGLAVAMTGPAMAIAIGYALKCPPLVLFSLAAVGFAANGLGGAGGPLAVLIIAIIAAEFGKAVQGETKVDILVTPLVTIGVGVGLSAWWAPALGTAAMKVGTLIMWATELRPFMMGILVSVIVGMALTLPISSAAICAALGLTGLAGGAAAMKVGNLIMWATELRPFMMGILVSVIVGMALTLPISSAAICAALGLVGLAGGAAVAGCCAQMVGFAVMSFPENKWGGLISQGIGTSMLQMGNIVKNPRIWIGPTLASAITGPIATCIFKLQMNGAPVSSGMGTCGFVGQIGVYSGWVNDVASGAKAAITGMDWLGLILICFVLPAVLAPLINMGCRKLGWVKDGDLTI